MDWILIYIEEFFLMGKNTITVILKKINISREVQIGLLKCKISCFLEFALKFSNNNGSTQYWFDCSNCYRSEMVTKGNIGYSLSSHERVCVCVNISVIQSLIHNL